MLGTANKSAKIAARSSAVFARFQKDITELESINVAADAETEALNIKMQEIENQQAQIKFTKESGTKLIGKLKEFLT